VLCRMSIMRGPLTRRWMTPCITSCQDHPPRLVRSDTCSHSCGAGSIHRLKLITIHFWFCLRSCCLDVPRNGLYTFFATTCMGIEDLSPKVDAPSVDARAEAGRSHPSESLVRGTFPPQHSRCATVRSYRKVQGIKARASGVLALSASRRSGILGDDLCPVDGT
jgi:hypothetical protein